MKSAVGLCLLFVLCTINAFPVSDDLEILRLQVRNAKWNVDDIIRHIQLLRNQVEEDTLLKVIDKWSNEQDSYRQFKTLLLAEIRNEIKTAESEGKDVSSCYDEAVDGIQKSDETAQDDATKCDEAAQNSIRNNLGLFNNLVLTGNSLSMELDNIFLDCHDSDIFQMKSCIIGELSRINGQVKDLQRDTTAAEIGTIPVSNNVVLQAENCLKKAYSFVHSTGAAIRLRVAQCIEKAEVPPEPTTQPPEEPEEPEEKKSNEP